MPATKVVFQPPHDFAVEAIEHKEGVVAITPYAHRGNVFVEVGHAVVHHEGTKLVNRIELNPTNGRLRLMRVGQPSNRRRAKT